MDLGDDEALATGSDPLHLTAMFGVADSTVRYATAARQLLQTPGHIDNPANNVAPATAENAP